MIRLLCAVVTGLGIAAGEPAVRPLTMKRTVAGYNAAGVQTITRTELFAIRSDGSQAESRVHVNGEPVVLRIVNDLGAAQRRVVEGKTHSVTTTPLPADQIRLLRPGPCGGSGDSPGDKILGFDTVLRVRRDDFGIQQVTIREWLAPALGCISLQREDIIERNGNLYGRQVTRPLSVVEGEPDPALFAIPSTAVERSREEVLRLHREATSTNK